MGDFVLLLRPRIDQISDQGPSKIFYPIGAGPILLSPELLLRSTVTSRLCPLRKKWQSVELLSEIWSQGRLKFGRLKKARLYAILYSTRWKPVARPSPGPALTRVSLG
ncbi:MAG: hypothetical protein V2A65_08060 [Candidatus Omnitrophota bacterium]